MLAVNEPIGRFIALANLEKDILLQKSIEQDIANLVDLITIRVKDKSIEEVANGLLESIFDLRFELIKWLAENKQGISNYLTIIDKHIAANLQLASFSKLAEAVSSVLLTYGNIVSPIFESQPNLFANIVTNIQENKPEYNSFKAFSHHPSPQVKYLKNWIDASLQLEVGLILADLILTKQIQFPKKRIKSELIVFLFDSITRFGAYSIFTGFWTPDSDNMSNLANRMKILSATLELENNIGYKTSKDAFFEMIEN